MGKSAQRRRAHLVSELDAALQTYWSYNPRDAALGLLPESHHLAHDLYRIFHWIVKWPLFGNQKDTWNLWLPNFLAGEYDIDREQFLRLRASQVVELLKTAFPITGVISEGEGAGGSKGRARPRRRRAVDPKAAKKRTERKQQRGIDDWIRKKWDGETWSGAADFAHTMNENGTLPPGFTGTLTDRYVKLSLDRTRQKRKRAGKPPKARAVN